MFFPQRYKSALTSTLILKYYLREILSKCPYKDCMQIFIALIIEAKAWKQPNVHSLVYPYYEALYNRKHCLVNAHNYRDGSQNSM